MSPSTFRLQTLLDLRRNAEAEKKRLYADAVIRRAAAEQQLIELETQWAIAKEKMVEEQTRQRQHLPPNFVSEGLARLRYLERLCSLVDQAQDKVRLFREGPMAKALAEEEAARLAFAEARKELEVVVKLEERERTLQKKHTLEREEAAMEERVVAVYGKVDTHPKD
jgi:flagellar biosynthesis chaperone FliJ